MRKFIICFFIIMLILGWVTPAHAAEYSYGTFKITAYCACKKCCGKNAKGLTRSGAPVQEGLTVAVDPEYIPLGTHLIIDGHEYIAQDTGSAVKGRIIDIYLSNHEKAREYGVKEKEVFIIE